MSASRRLGLWCLVFPALMIAACGHQRLGEDGRNALHTDKDWMTVPQVRLERQGETGSCGVAALTSVLSRSDKAVTQQSVRKHLKVPVTSAGLPAGQLRDTARAMGMDSFLVNGTFADLERELSAGRPALVGVVQIRARRAYMHYVTVAGINLDDERVLVADPAVGWLLESFKDFQEEWDRSKRLMLVVLPRELPATEHVTAP